MVVAFASIVILTSIALSSLSIGFMSYAWFSSETISTITAAAWAITVLISIKLAGDVEGES